MQSRIALIILLLFLLPVEADSIPQGKNPAIAQLRIPRLDIDVPVYRGTSRETLNRGAGFVVGTTVLGQIGNSAVSAHRDSHFEALQYVEVGDLVEVNLGTEKQLFSVEETFVTDALDVSVLDQTKSQVLTLITCFPFDYQGYAPDRFIVRARRDNRR